MASIEENLIDNLLDKYSINKTRTMTNTLKKFKKLNRIEDFDIIEVCQDPKGIFSPKLNKNGEKVSFKSRRAAENYCRKNVNTVFLHSINTIYI